MILDINPRHDKAKVNTDAAFAADKLQDFREYIHNQIKTDPDYVIPMDLIRGNEQKGSYFILTMKKTNALRRALRSTKIFSRVEIPTEELKEVRGKPGSTLATAYQKAPKPNPEERAVLMSGLERISRKD